MLKKKAKGKSCTCGTCKSCKGKKAGSKSMSPKQKKLDADKDGKLSQEELLKFGEEMGRRRMAEEGPDGDRPNDEGRSERPKRPE